MIDDNAGQVADPQPWIGSRYLDEPRRVLVIGESHKMDGVEAAPKDGTAYTGYTIQAVEWRIRGGHAPFFAKVEATLSADPASLDLPGDADAQVAARRTFWDTVAFANFVPAIMASQASRPTRKQWEAGRPRFIQLVDALGPHLVCLFSRTAFTRDYVPWGNAPDFDGLGREPTPVAGEVDLYRYPLIDGGTTLLAVFSHASRAAVVPARDRYRRLKNDLIETAA